MRQRSGRGRAKRWSRRFAEGLASTFLIGKPLGFDIADVMKLVKSDIEGKSARARPQRLGERH